MISLSTLSDHEENEFASAYIVIVIRICIQLVILPLFLAASCIPEEQDSFGPQFKLSSEPLFAIKETQAHTFGYLSVPENRSDPDSDTIELPVYIFKSRSKDPKPDPVIYTVGGPGSSTMPSAQYMAYYSYLDDRDVILFEQRGTRYARPHLDCPEWAEAIHQIALTGMEGTNSESLLVAAASACRERLTGQGIDLDGYRTTEVAADIADLRNTLNIDSYNLLTISYSTKIAQVLMRDHPEGIRSVVMDSPLPLESHYDEESTGNILYAMEMMLDDCAIDPDCNNAYPNLKHRFMQFLREATNEPLEVTVDHLENREPMTFNLSGKDLVTIFTHAGSGDILTLPSNINDLLAGDFSLIEEGLSDLYNGPGDGGGIGMRLSVWCAEELPFASKMKIREETHRYAELKGLSPAVFDPAVCDAWKVIRAPMSEDLAVQSEIPVLLISGEYDSETPARWAFSMLRNFPNGHHVIFPKWTHTPTTNWSDPCGQIVAREFFNHPGSLPDPDCLEALKEIQFILE